METNEVTQLELTPVINESDEAKVTFIRKTYLHLSLSLLAFMIVETFLLSQEWIVSIMITMSEGYLALITIFAFVFVGGAIENWAFEQLDKATQYLALGLYILVEALIFVPLLFIAIALTGDLSIILEGFIITVALFVGISFVALISGKRFTKLKYIVSVGSLIGLAFIVCAILFDFSLGLWFCLAMIGIGATSILYKTSEMQHTHNNQQYVAASLSLFASFAVVLRFVIRILSIFSRD